MNRGRLQTLALGVVVGGSVSNAAHAEGGAADLAKAAQNPIAAMISVPFQNNLNFNVGPEDKTQNILNIQPVIPVDLNAEWNLVTRTIVPVISQPALSTAQDRTNGLGDIQFSAFFSPKAATASGWIWGAGVIAQLDTATDDVLGAGKWGLGPTAVALKMDGPWVYGGLINNVWSIAGDDDRPDINNMLIQPFVNYNFPDKPGRYLTFAPIITANWEADSDNTWTVPFGGGVGRLFRIGKLPVNMSLQAFYNVEKPDDLGPDWTLRFQVQTLFPKSR